MSTPSDRMEADVSERETFNRYWLARQRTRGFGGELTDAEPSTTSKTPGRLHRGGKDERIP